MELFILISLVVGFLAVLFLYLKRIYTYWEKIGVTQLKPKLLLGDFYDAMTLKSSFGDLSAQIYTKLKSKSVDYGGVYMLHKPVFMPVHPELIKSILLKDANHFLDRGVYMNEQGDPLSANLFSLEGEKWKYLRGKLSPTFTSGKMKSMFYIVSDTADKLINVVNNDCKEPLDIKEILACYSTDVIATCAFGIECDSLNNPQEAFRKYGRIVLEFMGVLNLLTFVAPRVLKIFNVRIVKKEVSEFFMGVVRDNLSYREKNRVQRQDLFNLLIQLKNKGEITDDHDVYEKTTKSGITFNELAAQAFVFFLGGFETSSTASTFALYELSRNLEMQSKLRKEITAALDKYGGNITYEALSEMPYLEGVVYESLRKYPPLPVLNRICTQEYVIPNTNIKIEKGITVLVPVQGLHYDPDYFPNPEVFDPERFSGKSSRIPFTYLPFGDGPRICIGLRFGMMQTKIGLASLIKNFEVTLNPKTAPVTIDPASFATNTKDKIFLNFRKI